MATKRQITLTESEMRNLVQQCVLEILNKEGLIDEGLFDVAKKAAKGIKSFFTNTDKTAEIEQQTTAINDATKKIGDATKKIGDTL